MNKVETVSFGLMLLKLFLTSRFDVIGVQVKLLVSSSQLLDSKTFSYAILSKLGAKYFSRELKIRNLPCTAEYWNF